MVFDIETWGEANLTRWTKSAGVEWTCECPGCGGWSTFYVNGETGAHVCFKCDLKGKDATGLVALVEDISWAEARKYIFTSTIKLRRKTELLTLADRIRGLRPDLERDEEPGPMEFSLPKGFKPVWDDKRGWSYPAYLKERRVKAETAKRWSLGYCRFGKYANRLVIPIECPNGYSFTARAMEADIEPKYRNPDGADHARMLIGWNIHANRHALIRSDLCLVEGPLDAIKFDQHGIPALAVGGKVLHSEQLEMLFKLDANLSITVVLDPEERLSPLDIANQLAVHFTSIYIARLPYGTDPGDSTKTQALRALATAERFRGVWGERMREHIGLVKRKAEDRF